MSTTPELLVHIQVEQEDGEMLEHTISRSVFERMLADYKTQQKQRERAKTRGKKITEEKQLLINKKIDERRAALSELFTQL